MYNKVESITPASNKVITHFNPIEPKEPKYEQIEDMENENERWTRYENNKKKETSCKYCDEIEDVAFEILTRSVFVSFELLGNCLVHACK